MTRGRLGAVAAFMAYAAAEAAFSPLLEPGASRLLGITLSASVAAPLLLQQRHPVAAVGLALALYVGRDASGAAPVDTYVFQVLILVGFYGAIADGPRRRTLVRVVAVAVLIVAARRVPVPGLAAPPLMSEVDRFMWLYVAALATAGAGAALRIRDRSAEVRALRVSLAKVEESLGDHELQAAEAENRRVGGEIETLLSGLLDEVRAPLLDARRALGNDPAGARWRLDTVARMARESSEELRRLVSHLTARRPSGEPREARPAERAAAPRLPRPDGLVILLVLLGLADVANRGVTDATATGLLVAALLPCPLVLRRTRPLLAFALLGGLIVLGAALSAQGASAMQTWLAAICGAYVLGGVTLSRGRMTAGLLMAVGLPQIAMVLEPTPWALQSYVSYGLLLVGAWAAGYAVRERVAEAAATGRELRALRARRRVAEQRAVAAERARLARELHDAIGQSVLLIGIQATVAQTLAEKDPSAAGRAVSVALTAVTAASAELEWLHRTASDDATRSSDADLRRLPELVALLRQAGQRVTLEQTGDLRVPEALSRDAFRIAQEALTNATKHASGSDIVVTVSRGTDALTVAVRSGRGQLTAEVSGGRGLRHMAARAGAHGGALEITADRSGWVVTARFPTPPRGASLLRGRRASAAITGCHGSNLATHHRRWLRPPEP